MTNPLPDASCDLTAAFGIPVPVAGLESRAISSVRLSADEKQLFYSALNGCSQEVCFDLFSTTRETTSDPFPLGSPLGGVNSNASSEYFPTLGRDNQIIFFESSRSIATLTDGGYYNDQARIWTAVRQAEFQQFGTPYIQGPFAEVTGIESAPYLNFRRRALYFSSSARDGGLGNFDIYRATLNEFGGAQSIDNVVPINSTRFEGMPVVTLDDLTIYFGRERPDNTREILRAQRLGGSTSSPFGQPALVAELNTTDDNFPTWISDDQCRMYFISTRPLPNLDGGGLGPGIVEGHAWVAERPARAP